MFNFGNKKNIDLKISNEKLINYIPIKATYSLAIVVLIVLAVYLLVVLDSNRVYVFTPNAIASRATVFFDEIKDEKDVSYYSSPYFNLVIDRNVYVEIGGGVTYIKGRFVYLSKQELNRTHVVDLSPDDRTFYSIDGYIPSKKSSLDSFLVHIIRDKNSYEMIIKDPNFKSYTVKYGGAVAKNELGELYYIDTNIIEELYFLSPISKNYKIN